MATQKSTTPRFETGIETVRRLMPLTTAPASAMFKLREHKGAPRCAYDVLIKEPHQPRGRVMFTLVWTNQGA
jgi:hypothetical protein